MNGKEAGKLAGVNGGIEQLSTKIAEQKAKRQAAEAELGSLRVQWADLCKRVDVQGESGLQGDISACEARMATAQRTIERCDVVLPELQERLRTAEQERGRILYHENAAEVERLNKLDTPLLKRYIAAARALLAVAEDVNKHEAAKGALVIEANNIARASGLSPLHLRRLPLFDVNTEDVGGAEKQGSLEWFIEHDIAPRWAEPL